MQGLDPLDEDAGGTVFRDVILLALMGFVALVILMLPHVHPPQAKTSDDPLLGNVVVEIRWPDEIDADVDLWVLAPGDKPVGFSNRGGLYFDLLRDDLGSLQDITASNVEMAYSRGVPAGEYIVNVHMYRNETGIWPVPVQVLVSMKTDITKAATPVLRSKVVLVREDQEETVFRFTIDRDGELDYDSVSHIYRKLSQPPASQRL
ncbi:MAG: hypothetical protein O3B22_15085 [Proteobacteria bacterium]|nr:hypothetical protein [Pseudomonadota bacterium]MDA0952151.1 hypothetical protein [Pseudomonadota bacterium]